MKIRFSGLALIGLSAICLSAQQTNLPQVGTIVKNVNEVNLIFSAVDRHNHFVANLQENQIQIFDNKRLQEVSKFDAQGNLPLRIALLLDVSNSIRERWQFEQQAALDFLQSLLIPGRDKAMVMAFDASPQMVQEFTDDWDKISEGVHGLRPGGGTALWDALLVTAHDKMYANSGDLVRNVIIVVSDGDDDQSRYSRDEALAQVENAGAVVYAVDSDPTHNYPDAEKSLRKIADETGGELFLPVAARDLGTAFQNILTELRNQYVVTYRPDNFVPNGAKHTIDLKISVKGVVARTRSGYFANPTGGTSPNDKQ